MIQTRSETPVTVTPPVDIAVVRIAMLDESTSKATKPEVSADYTTTTNTIGVFDDDFIFCQ